jgi:hypothetical protein
MKLRGGAKDTFKWTNLFQNHFMLSLRITFEEII